MYLKSVRSLTVRDEQRVQEEPADGDVRLSHRMHQFGALLRHQLLIQEPLLQQRTQLLHLILHIFRTESRRLTTQWIINIKNSIMEKTEYKGLDIGSAEIVVEGRHRSFVWSPEVDEVERHSHVDRDHLNTHEYNKTHRAKNTRNFE